ncbi:MAG TPA: hypothetical protein VMV83_17785 [Rectinemataceae bacterium]|nr:hypothetical protein [Rectinemataceae bacterium]
MNQKAFRILVVAAILLAILILPLSAQNKPDTRVQTLLDKIDQEYTVTKAGNYQVELDTKDDRTQFVYISSATEKYSGIEIREIWSNAGTFPEEPDQATLLDLMTESGSNKIGCWALEKQDDGSYLLYYTIKLPISFTASDLKMMIAFSATIADAREEQFFGTDDD